MMMKMITITAAVRPPATGNIDKEHQAQSPQLKLVKSRSRPTAVASASLVLNEGNQRKAFKRN